MPKRTFIEGLRAGLRLVQSRPVVTEKITPPVATLTINPLKKNCADSLLGDISSAQIIFNGDPAAVLYGIGNHLLVLEDELNRTREQLSELSAEHQAAKNTIAQLNSQIGSLSSDRDTPVGFNIKNFLAANVRPATGCTEPGSVAFAVAVAIQAALGNLPKKQADGTVQYVTKYEVDGLISDIQKIELVVDRDIFKNAAGVYIPGTQFQKGLPIAAAMGVFCDPKDGLNLFSGITEETLTKANVMRSRISLEQVIDKDPVPTLKVEVIVKLIGGKTIFVRLHYDHAFIESIEINGAEVYTDSFTKKSSLPASTLPETMGQLFHVVTNILDPEREYLLKGLERNLTIAYEGLKTPYGLATGRSYLGQEFSQHYKKIVKDPAKIFFLKDMDIFRLTRILLAAGVDARMGGAQFSVTSTSGSGNQGLAATMSIIAIAEAVNRRTLWGRHSPAGLKLITTLDKPSNYHLDQKRIAEATLIAHLITAIATAKIGVMGAWCGCGVKAGLASAAAAAYLLGGTAEQVNTAINLVAAGTTGTICDGAKPGCAIKLGVDGPIQAAIMALKGTKVQEGNGIVRQNAFSTIKAIGRVAETTYGTDVILANILSEKSY